MGPLKVVLVFTDTLSLAFRLDIYGLLFFGLALSIWVVVAFYTLKYRDVMTHTLRYFSFYFLTLLMLAGMAFAANYLTLYLFFEMMTLASVPLVLHEETAEAISAAKKYLFYSIFGATLGLLGFFFVQANAVHWHFRPGGVLDPALSAGRQGQLLTAAFLSVAGFGAKAGLFPLHAWLIAAHPVAPSPASAVLSAIITKAGAFCIFRVVHFQYGLDFLRETWVQRAWIGLALVTILMGSLMAYREERLKTRLAYSSVSQVSYVLLGIFLMNETALSGAFLHALFHAILKSGLFLFAGNLLYRGLGARVGELQGLGHSMPLSFACLTVFSLGLTGIPPLAGFLSKWDLALGALATDLSPYAWLAPVILIASALLTAAYLFPLVIHGFFPGEDFDGAVVKVKEAPWPMTAVLSFLALAALATGLAAGPIRAYLYPAVALLFP